MPGMDDTRHDTTDVSHDTTNTTVDVSEAAAILGISEDAVRARIRRGKLHGEKVGAVWRVYLDAVGNVQGTDDSTTDSRDTTADRATRHDNATGMSHDTTEHATVDLAPLAELIERLSRENADLSAAATGWQARAMRAEDELKQLTATVPSTDEAVESSESDDTDDQDHEHQHEETSAPASVWARLWRRIAGVT